MYAFATLLTPLSPFEEDVWRGHQTVYFAERIKARYGIHKILLVAQQAAHLAVEQALR